MKWIPIDKAKVKFYQDYLIASKSNKPIQGQLLKSKTTQQGVAHEFADSHGIEIAGVTHICIITDPNKEPE